jgi:protein-disulfide isomerase
MRLRIAILIGVSGFLAGFSAVAALRLRHPSSKAAATVPTAETAAALGLPDPRFVYRVQLGTAPLRGPADAPVTVVVFGSYGNAATAALAQSLDRLTAEAPGRVRVAWKDLPATPQARVAARAARAAVGQGRFWELHDRLVTAAQLDDASLEREATTLGLDLMRWRAALADAAPDHAIEHAIDADIAQARRFGLDAAPAVFVNGRFVPDPSLAHLREQIDEARGFAEQLVADGTPRDQVYAALMRGALPRSGPISATPLPEDAIEALQ